MRNILVILLLFTFISGSMAQKAERIQPGKLYAEGSDIESPRYGFTGTIPDGWVGMLPQGAEIFMLNKVDGTSGEVLLFARPDGNLDQLIGNWEKGGALTDAIYLRSTDDITREGDMAFAEIVGEGERINKAYKGFIIGRCSEYGPCVTMLMITPGQFYEEVRDEMLDFMKSSKFIEPYNRNPYEDFDWTTFLSNKVLVTYEMTQGAKRQNMIHLCADGTFQSNIKQDGWLKKQNKAYLGKNKGTWKVDGTGSETELSLVFEKTKIPPIDLVMSIKDEKIYALNERYYAGYSDQCD